ncbi:MAG TPA: hypothetical protein VD763_12120, partial [Candidatus Saccharimonadales bacterium]|nr:hypothetical protein [Candidatus Saccharimonadales bacterium]
ARWDAEPPSAGSGAGLAAAFAMPRSVMASAGATAMATPGAYVPPAPVMPAGPAAPARAWGTGDAASGAAAVAAAATLPGDPARDRDDVRLREATGWLAVGGAAIAAAGFVLPWATSVIGASGVGYFDRWGMAGPGHLLAVIALLAIVGLNLVANPVPAWIRVGLVGLGLGPLLLGLAWPYLFSRFLGTEVGVYAVGIGALLLTIAGILALVGDRHATARRPV